MSGYVCRTWQQVAKCLATRTWQQVAKCLAGYVCRTWQQVAKCLATCVERGNKWPNVWLATCVAHIRSTIYTVSQKNYTPLMFYNNFGKCGSIFKILSPTDSWENSLWMHTKTSTSPAICRYTTLWNSKIQKVTKFSRWTWQLICSTKICCEILCNLPQRYCTNDFT